MRFATVSLFRAAPLLKNTGFFLTAAALLATAMGAELPDPARSFRLEDYLIAPIRVHLLKSEEQQSLRTTLTDEDIDRILTKVNRIWSQAGIGFYVESLVREAPAEPASGETAIASRALSDIIPKSTYSDELFNIYYLKEFEVNGIYFPKAIFVKDTASLRAVEGGIDEPLPRVTAHELGHALGLDHRQATFNLMASGTTGTLLNSAEIDAARRKAGMLGKFTAGLALMVRADALFDKGETRKAATIYRAFASLPLDCEPIVRARERLQASGRDIQP